MIKRFFLPEVLTGTSKDAVSFSGSVSLQLLRNLFDKNIGGFLAALRCYSFWFQQNMNTGRSTA